MPTAKNYDGIVFGRLTVLKDAARIGKYIRVLRCRCICGKIVERRLTNLTTGNTTSCGCFRIETSRQTALKNVTHNASYTIEYNQYRAMIARCYYKGQGGYKYYGARGIRVCARWRGKKGFENFSTDMGPRPSKRHSIDRKDHNKNYEPANCYWATPKEQIRNRRNTIWINYRGRKITLGEACDSTPLDYGVIYARIKRGWSVAVALETPCQAGLVKNVSR